MPSRSTLIGTAVVLLVAAIAGAMLFGGPLVKYWKGRTADAEAGREFQTDRAESKSLEVTGTKELTNAASDLAAAAGNLRSQTHVVEVRTRADPAVASLPALPKSELDRLRAHDLELCGRSLECRPGGGPAAPRGPAASAPALPVDDSRRR